MVVEFIVYFIFALLFLGIGFYLLYLYYSTKRYEWGFKNEGKKSGYHDGSYKGFWHKNRHNILIFSAYLLVFLGAAFLAISIGVYV